MHYMNAGNNINMRQRITKDKWHGNWNDRHLRRVFLCFYLAIFKLTSVKFQTFAYNSRTVWFSFIKFWQQDSKTVQKIRHKKRSHSKWIKYTKKYFLWVYLQPTFGRDKIFFPFVSP